MAALYECHGSCYLARGGGTCGNEDGLETEDMASKIRGYEIPRRSWNGRDGGQRWEGERARRRESRNHTCRTSRMGGCSGVPCGVKDFVYGYGKVGGMLVIPRIPRRVFVLTGKKERKKKVKLRVEKPVLLQGLLLLVINMGGYPEEKDCEGF